MQGRGGTQATIGWAQRRFPMHSRIVVLGLALFGATLPGLAIAQSDLLYSSGLVIPPLPVMPGPYPYGAISSAPNIYVNVTRSTVPQMMTVAPDRDTTGSVDHSRCTVQTYTFGPRERVRVQRCY